MIRITESEIINVPYTELNCSTGITHHGYMLRNEVQDKLATAGEQARQELKRNKRKHALYGVKEFDKGGMLKVVRLFTNCYVTDKELSEIIYKYDGGLLYVIHGGR